jgi:hypothetical protein
MTPNLILIQCVRVTHPSKASLGRIVVDGMRLQQKRANMATGKKRLYGRSRLLVAFWTALLMVGLTGATSCLAQSVVVALLPVETMTAPLDSLGEGVRAMLTSRLAGQGGLAMVSPGRVDRVLGEIEGGLETPAILFETLGAAYLLASRLQAVDSGWLLRVEVLDPFTPGHAVQTFRRQGQAHGEIPTAVDQLAADLNAFLLNRERTARESASPTAVDQGEEMAAFRTAHPERSDLDILFYAGVYRIESAGVDVPVVEGMQAMDVGDVEGDGEEEIFLATASRIVVGKVQDQAITEAAVYPIPDGLAVHALSVADLNGNGRQEIFVSATAGDVPRSFILEWDGAGLSLLAHDLGWYIRVLNVPGEGPVLIGQRFDAVIAGQIFRLRWREKTLVAARRVSVPQDRDLFGFVLADLDGDGKPESISLDGEHRLEVHDHQGSLLWQSKASYGVTQRAVSGRRLEEELIPLFEPTRRRFAVPSRLVLTDFNGDGQTDVVVNEPREALGGLGAAGGTICGFSWDGGRLRKVWQTPLLAGSVLDYQVRPTARTVESNGAENDSVPLSLYVGLVDRLLVFQMDLGWL